MTRDTGKANAREDVLAVLPGASGTVAIAVRTTECSPHRGCEWRMGKGTAFADDPGLFVALVDLRRYEEVSRVWLVPSTEVSRHFAFLDKPSPHRYRRSETELAGYEDAWGVLEEHLLGERVSRKGWFSRGELAERYGEDFVDELDAEASRLLKAENSLFHEIADELDAGGAGRGLRPAAGSFPPLERGGEGAEEEGWQEVLSGREATPYTRRFCKELVAAHQ